MTANTKSLMDNSGLLQHLYLLLPYAIIFWNLAIMKARCFIKTNTSWTMIRGNATTFQSSC